MNICLNNLTKSINHKDILNNLSFNFISPNLYIIKGNNGAGKTTLLYILSLLDLNFSGDFLIDNVNIKKLSKKEISDYKRSQITILFSKGNLISYLNVRENTYLLSKNNDFDLTFLQNIINEDANTLSGGEEIQVALNCEIAKNKELILLDEVTSSLDLDNFNTIMNKLIEVAKEKLIILVSHDQRTYNYGTLLELKNGKLSTCH